MKKLLIALALISTVALAGGVVEKQYVDANNNIVTVQKGGETSKIVESGTYLAKFSAPLNCSTPGDATFHYIAVGNTVTVTGRASCVVTTINLATSINVSLPFPSSNVNLINGLSNWSRQVDGVLSAAGYVEGFDANTARVKVRRVAIATTNNIFITFTYQR